MSDLQPPSDPRDMRCSDADRDAVAESLRTAMADGRLDYDEMSDRLDRVYAAKTYRELEPLVSDLPGGPGAPLPALRPPGGVIPGSGQSSLDRVGGVPTSGSAIAVMGGATRKGAWVVPESFTAIAVMGGVELDLRQARFESSSVTITAVAFWGGIEITASPDLHVITDGVGVMGGFDGPLDDVGADGRVTVRVRGVALMGGVEVTVKDGRQGSKPLDPGTDPDRPALPE